MIVFQVVLGVVYAIVGIAKLAGAKPLAEQFEEFGLGLTVMRIVGALEVAAAVGLFIDGLDTLAAVGMVAMMIGALGYHRRVGHAAADSTPAIVVLVASLVYAALSV
ncbi:MAG: DoxX family protein [Actinomycetota bacterium]